jgi:hypothetical protein
MLGEFVFDVNEGDPEIVIGISEVSSFQIGAPAEAVVRHRVVPVLATEGIWRWLEERGRE